MDEKNTLYADMFSPAAVDRITAKREAVAKAALDKQVKFSDAEIVQGYDAFMQNNPNAPASERKRFLDAYTLYRDAQNASTMDDIQTDLSIAFKNRIPQLGSGIAYLATGDDKHMDAYQQQQANIQAKTQFHSDDLLAAKADVAAREAARAERLGADGEIGIGDTLTSFFGSVGDRIANPLAAVSEGAQSADSLASMIAGGGVVGVAAKAGAKKAVARRLGKEAMKRASAQRTVAKAGEKAADTAAGAFGMGFTGVSEGANNGMQVVQEIENLDDDVLLDSSEFKKLMKAKPDKSFQELRKEFALSGGRDAAVISGVTAAAIGKGTGASDFFSKALVKQPTKADGIIKRAIEKVSQSEIAEKAGKTYAGKGAKKVANSRAVSGAGKEFVEEAFQSGSGQLIGNIQVKEADESKQVLEGVGTAAGAGAASGAVTGGAMGAAGDVAIETAETMAWIDPVNRNDSIDVVLEPAPTMASKLSKKSDAITPEMVQSESTTALKNIQKAAKAEMESEGISGKDKATVSALYDTIATELDTRSTDDDDDDVEVDDYIPSALEKKLIPPDASDVYTPDQIQGLSAIPPRTLRKDAVHKSDEELDSLHTTLNNTIASLPAKSSHRRKLSNLASVVSEEIGGRKALKDETDAAIKASTPEQIEKAVNKVASSGGKGNSATDIARNSMAAIDPQVSDSVRKTAAANMYDAIEVSAADNETRGTSRSGFQAAATAVGKAVTGVTNALTNLHKNNPAGAANLEKVHKEIVTGAQENIAKTQAAVIADDEVVVQHNVTELNKSIVRSEEILAGKTKVPAKYNKHSPDYLGYVRAELEYLKSTKQLMEQQIKSKEGLAKKIDMDKKEQDPPKISAHIASPKAREAIVPNSPNIALNQKGHGKLLEFIGRSLSNHKDGDILDGTVLSVIRDADLTEDERAYIKDIQLGNKKAGSESAEFEAGIAQKLDAKARDVSKGNNLAHMLFTQDDAEYNAVYNDTTLDDTATPEKISDNEYTKASGRKHTVIPKETMEHHQSDSITSEELKVVHEDLAATLQAHYDIEENDKTAPAYPLNPIRADIQKEIAQMEQEINNDKVANTSTKRQIINPFKNYSGVVPFLSYASASVKKFFKARGKGKMVFRIPNLVTNLLSDNEDVTKPLYNSVSAQVKNSLRSYFTDLQGRLVKRKESEDSFVTWANGPRKGNSAFVHILDNLTKEPDANDPEASFHRMMYIVNSDGSVSMNPAMDNIRESLAVSTLTWFQTMGAGVDEGALKHYLIQAFNLGEVDIDKVNISGIPRNEIGNTITYVTESLGQNLAKNMGIEAESTAGAGAPETFVHDLGNYALHMMVDMGLIEKHSMRIGRKSTDQKFSFAKMSAKAKPTTQNKDQGKSPKKSVGKAKTVEVVLISMTDEGKQMLQSTLGDDRQAANAFLGQLTGNAHSSTGTYTEEQAVVIRGDISAAHQEGLDARAQQGLAPDLPMIKSLLEMYDTAELREALYNALGVYGDDRALAPILRNRNKTNRENIDKTMLELRQIDANPEEFAAIYQRVKAGSNMRTSESSALSWQGDKVLARAILAGTTHTMTFNDKGKNSANITLKDRDGKKAKDEFGNEIRVTHEEAFKVGIARALGEDKLGYLGHINLFNSKYGFPEATANFDDQNSQMLTNVDAEVERSREAAINAARHMNGEKLTTDELKDMYAETERLGHATESLMGMVAVGQYLIAKKAGKTSAKITLFREDDGITNGPAIVFAMMGFGSNNLGELIKTGTALGFNIKGVPTLQDLRNGQDTPDGKGLDDLYVQLREPVLEKVNAFGSSPSFGKDTDTFIEQDAEGNLSYKKNSEGAPLVPKATTLGQISPLSSGEDVSLIKGLAQFAGIQATGGSPKEVAAAMKALREYVKEPLMRMIYGAGLGALLDNVRGNLNSVQVKRLNGLYQDYLASDRSEDARLTYRAEVEAINKNYENLSRLQREPETGYLYLSKNPRGKHIRVTVDSKDNFAPVISVVTPGWGKRKESVRVLENDSDMNDHTLQWDEVIGRELIEAITERMKVSRAMLDSYHTVFHTASKMYVNQYIALTDKVLSAKAADERFLTVGDEADIKAELGKIFRGFPSVLTDKLHESTINGWKSVKQSTTESPTFTTQVVVGKNKSTSSKTGRKDTLKVKHKKGNSAPVHATDSALIVAAVRADKDLVQVFDGIIQSPFSNKASIGANNAFADLWKKKKDGKQFSILEAAVEAIKFAHTQIGTVDGVPGRANMPIDERIAGQLVGEAAQGNELYRWSNVIKNAAGEEIKIKLTPDMELAIVEGKMVKAQKLWMELVDMITDGANQYGDVFQGKVGVADGASLSHDFHAIVEMNTDLASSGSKSNPITPKMRKKYMEVQAAFSEVERYSNDSELPTTLEGWTELMDGTSFSPPAELVIREHTPRSVKKDSNPTEREINKKAFTSAKKATEGEVELPKLTGFSTFNIAALVGRIKQAATELIDSESVGELTNEQKQEIIAGYGDVILRTRNMPASTKDELTAPLREMYEDLSVEVEPDQSNSNTGDEQAQVKAEAKQGAADNVNEGGDHNTSNNNDVGSGSRAGAADPYGIRADVQLLSETAEIRKKGFLSLLQSFVQDIRGNVSANHVDHLTAILGQVASTYENLKHDITVRVLKDSSEGVESYGNINGRMDSIEVYLPDTMQGGLAMSSAEALVHEALHPLWKFGLNRSAKIRAEGLRLFKSVTSNPDLDYTIMMDPDITHPSATDIKIAKERFDYIFGSGSKGKNLEEFLTYAMSNEAFRKRLDNLLGKKEARPSGFWNRLLQTFRKIFGVITKDRIGYSRAGMNVREGVDRLFLETQSTLNRAREKEIRAHTRKPKNIYGRIDKAGGKLITSLIPQLRKYQALAVSKGFSKDLVRGTSDMLAEAIRKTLNEKNDEMNIHVRSFFSGFLGRPDAVHTIGRFIEMGTASIDAVAFKMKEAQRKVMLSTFKKQVTKQQNKDMYWVVGKADIGTLSTQGYSHEAIIEMLDDPAKLDATIKVLQAEVAREVDNSKTLTNALLGHLNAATHYVIHEDHEKGIHLQNAYQIVKQVMQLDNQKFDVDTINTDLVQSMDTLWTLDALSKIDPETRKRVADMDKHEDTKNGLATVIASQAAYMKVSKEHFAYAHQEYLMTKGYTHDITNEDKDVLVTALSEEAKLRKQGYVLADTIKLAPGTLSTRGVVGGVFVRNFSSSNAKSNSALYAVQEGRVGESIGEILAATQIGKDPDIIQVEQSEIVRRSQAMLDNETRRFAQGKPVVPNVTSGLLPVPTRSKTSFNWRMHTVNTKFKEKNLDMGYDFIESISRGIAGIEYKRLTPDHNLKIIDYLVEEAEGYQDEPEAFAVLSFDDHRVVDQIKQLDKVSLSALKRAFPDEVLKVRKSQLVPLFGYRRFSPMDVERMGRAPKGQGTLIDGLIRLTNNMIHTALNNKAMGRLWYGHTQIIKEVNKNIVIRGGSLIINNGLGNILIAAMVGMNNPVKLLKDVAEGWKMASDYETLRLAGTELQAKLTIEENMAKPNQRKITRLKAELGGNANALSAHPMGKFDRYGLHSTVTTEVTNSSSAVDAGTGFIRGKFEPLLSNTGVIGEALKNAYGTEDSATYRLLQGVMVNSEFGFKYAYYKHLKSTTDLSEDKIVNKIDTIFFNYGTPSAKPIDALEQAGVVMYPKFFLKAQAAMVEAFAESPSRVLGTLALQNVLAPSVSGFEDSSLLGNGSISQIVYNPFSGYDDLASPTVLVGAVDLLTD